MTQLTTAADGSPYCGRQIGPEQVEDWHRIRRKMALFDLDELRATLASCALVAGDKRPDLLFGVADVDTIRQRATDAIRERIRAECETLIAEAPEDVEGRNCAYTARPARTVAGGFLVLQDERYAQWVRRRTEALLALPSWMGEVHKKFIKRCDHIMANAGAALACAHDWLGDAADDTFTDQLADGLRSHLLLPYLEGARKRDEHWSRDTYLANWKIMTCGETGLAICAFADRWPEAREALALSADSVLEILDVVPREGDWPEGVGYWYSTLYMGLRFGLALRRLTGGKTDLLTHPRLAITGDFGAAHISPSGRVYNYGDNPTALGEHPAEALLILGVEKDRDNWRAAARHFPSYSPLWLHLDDPAAANAPTPDGAYRFPATGAAILRHGSTFVGMHGGSTTVGHAHLDNNSFILETRGTPVLIDEGNWPYAHFLGFFSRHDGYGGRRWNFDALATVGHNAILVDGQGQAYGAAYAGQLAPPVTGNGWMRLDGDGSACYPGLLTAWHRSLLLVGEAWLVIRDVIACEGERHVEWLMHPGPNVPVRDDGDDSVLEGDGGGVRIVPLLPDRTMGWRISDVSRRSVYENSNTGEREEPTIHYRSFAPFRAAASFEFLFLVQLDPTAGGTYEFMPEAASWQLALPDNRTTVLPDGDTMRVAHLLDPSKTC